MQPISLLVCAAAAAALFAQDPYALGADSQRQAGVPQGKVTQYTFASPKVYPGSVRDYWIYVPAQYNAGKPAPVMVFQDGGTDVKEDGQFRATIVMDNLIHKGEMPATIGIFVNPGVMPARSANEQARFNRSYEYDGLGDRYARFLLDELIPEVSGKNLNLSKDPDDWALAGVSSGGIAAFNAAWMRPDAFRRVMSFIGSFTNLRGSQTLASLVRKTEPRPLRVFLQDGSNDNNIYAGSWWVANQDLAASFEYSGYDYKFVTGTEAHNRKHGGAVLPDAMRWLWRDYGKPLAKPRPGARANFGQFMEPDSGWELVSQGHGFTEGTTVDKQGNVYFTDYRQDKIWKIDTAGKVSVFKDKSNQTIGLKVGPDGRLYGGQPNSSKLVAIDMDGRETVLAEGVKPNDFVLNSKGEIYYTEPPTKSVWFMNTKGERKKVHEGLEFPNGIQLSPDQSLLMVADSTSKWVWSFQVQPDGSLTNGEPFYRLETPDESSRSSADGMTVDTDGFLYVTTNMGVQICDPPGRVNLILPKPQASSLANVVFGGSDMQMMYVAAGDKVYRRHMKRKGALPWVPVKPPQPRL